MRTAAEVSSWPVPQDLVLFPNLAVAASWWVVRAEHHLERDMISWNLTHPELQGNTHWHLSPLKGTARTWKLLYLVTMAIPCNVSKNTLCFNKQASKHTTSQSLQLRIHLSSRLGCVMSEPLLKNYKKDQHVPHFTRTGRWNELLNSYFQNCFYSIFNTFLKEFFNPYKETGEIEEFYLYLFYWLFMDGLQRLFTLPSAKPYHSALRGMIVFVTHLYQFSNLAIHL
jgi:hypothetical protein